MKNRIFTFLLLTAFTLNSSLVFAQNTKSEGAVSSSLKTIGQTINNTTIKFFGSYMDEATKRRMKGWDNNKNTGGNSTGDYNLIMLSNSNSKQVEDLSEKENDIQRYKNYSCESSINLTAINEEFEKSCKVLSGSILDDKSEFTEIGSMLSLSSSLIFDINSNSKQCDKCFGEAINKLSGAPTELERKEIDKKVSSLIYEKALEKEISDLTNIMDTAIKSIALRENALENYFSRNNISEDDKAKILKKLTCSDGSKVSSLIKNKCGTVSSSKMKILSRVLGQSISENNFFENYVGALSKKTEFSKNSMCENGDISIKNFQKVNYIKHIKSDTYKTTQKHMDNLIDRLKGDSIFKKEVCSSNSENNTLNAFRNYMTNYGLENSNSILSVTGMEYRLELEKNNSIVVPKNDEEAAYALFNDIFEADTFSSMLLKDKNVFCNKVLSSSKKFSEIVERTANEDLKSFEDRQFSLLDEMSGSICEEHYEELAGVICANPDTFVENKETSPTDLKEASKIVFNNLNDIDTKSLKRKLILGQKVCSLEKSSDIPSVDIGTEFFNHGGTSGMSNFTKDFIDQNRSIAQWDKFLTESEKMALVNKLSTSKIPEICLDDEDSNNFVNTNIQVGFYKIPATEDQVNQVVASSIAKGLMSVNDIPAEYAAKLSEDYDLSGSGKKRVVRRERSVASTGLPNRDFSESTSDNTNLLNSYGPAQTQQITEDNSSNYYHTYRQPAAVDESQESEGESSSIIDSGRRLASDEENQSLGESSSSKALNSRIEELNKQIAEIEKNNRLLQEKLLKAKESGASDLDDIEKQIAQDEKRLAEMKSEKRGLEKKLANSSSNSIGSGHSGSFSKGNNNTNSNSNSSPTTRRTASSNGSSQSSSGTRQKSSTTNNGQAYNNVSYNKIQLVKVNPKLIESINKIDDFSNTRVQTTMIGGKSVITAVLFDEGWVDIKELPEDIRMKILKANEGIEIIGETESRDIASEKDKIIEKPIEVNKNPGLFDSLNDFLQKNVDTKVK